MNLIIKKNNGADNKINCIWMLKIEMKYKNNWCKEKKQ